MSTILSAIAPTFHMGSPTVAEHKESERSLRAYRRSYKESPPTSLAQRLLSESSRRHHIPMITVDTTITSISSSIIILTITNAELEESDNYPPHSTSLLPPTTATDINI